MDVINPVFLFTDYTPTEINRGMDKDFFHNDIHLSHNCYVRGVSMQGMYIFRVILFCHAQ